MPESLPDKIQTRNIVLVTAFARGQSLVKNLQESLQTAKLFDDYQLVPQIKVVDLSQSFSWPQSLWSGPFLQGAENTEEGPQYSLQVLTRFGTLDLSHSEGLGRFSVLAPNFSRSLQRFRQWKDRGASLTASGSMPGDLDFADWDHPIRLPGHSSLWRNFKNVNLVKAKQVIDFAIGSDRRVTGIEVSGSDQTLQSSDFLAWFFSTQECDVVSPRAKEVLFSQKSPEPVSDWLVSRGRWENPPPLPPYFFAIDDPGVHWGAPNGLVLQKMLNSKENSSYWIWYRQPHALRFSEGRLESLRQNIEQILNAWKLPGAGRAQVELPLEAKAHYQEVGPALFSCFSEGAQPAAEAKLNNILLYKPQRVGGIAPRDLAEAEAEMAKNIIKWWQLEVKKSAERVRKLVLRHRDKEKSGEVSP